MKINFVNQTKEKTLEIQKVIRNIFKTIKDKKIFNIIFVDEETIQKINREYRQIDKVTDVISFSLKDGEDLIEVATEELGDIFICLQRAYDQAEEYHHSVEREVGFLAVHGYLHLCGYDHMTKSDEEEMCAKQDEILNKANLYRK